MKKAKARNLEEQEAAKNGKGRVAVGAGEEAEAQVTPPEERNRSEDVETDANPAGEANEQADPVVELRATIERLEDRLLREKAESQNFRRRSAADRAAAIRFANAELIKSLLSVIDDFERSLEAARESDNLQAVVEGVRLVYGNLLKALRAWGLEPIDALHEPFDPKVHEAMMQQPSADFPPGTVIEEVAKGYRLHDRVLRPAKVVVSHDPVAEEGRMESEPRAAPTPEGSSEQM